MLDVRAYRLTAAGLTRLVTLPQLASLSCHGLDTCLDAATASCFALSPSLQQLHLVRACLCAQLSRQRGWRDDRSHSHTPLLNAAFCDTPPPPNRPLPTLSAQGCDYEVPDAALQQLRDVAGGLSMCFRWTDKLAGLLRTARLHLQARLVRAASSPCLAPTR
jgi:hypothetical protein